VPGTCEEDWVVADGPTAGSNEADYLFRFPDESFLKKAFVVLVEALPSELNLAREHFSRIIRWGLWERKTSP
jgi:hypothetical protein